jgi:hypothetical protein
MALLNKTDLSAAMNLAFSDNNSGDITPSDLRTIHQDIIDSMLALTNSTDQTVTSNLILSGTVKNNGVSIIDDNVAITFGSSPYTVTTTRTVIYVDATGGDVTVNLPTASLGIYCNVIKTDSSTNSVIIATTSTINGDASISLDYQYESAELQSNASEYFIK